MTDHELRSWPGSFDPIWDGRKVHDVRVDDRNFTEGDRVRLRRWNPVIGRRDPDAGYTGREITADVTFVTRGGEFGLPERLCVLSLKVLTRSGK